MSRKGRKGKGKMKVPDRWLPYTPIGKRIPGTRFITFKVPLKQAICDNLGEGDRFTPQMLMEQRPDVQLVVDLTNTAKYYNKASFTDAGVAYKKILTPGHVIPAKRCILEFFRTVDEFLDATKNDDSLIGVHCTHGLNRTSYFVCCYMIHQMGFEPQNAVAAFETARGHKIERANYVNDLLSRGMGSDEHRERGGNSRDMELRGPGHRGPQRFESRPRWDSRSGRPRMEISHGQRDSRPHGPGHRDTRPHFPGQRDSRPHGSGQRDSRANSTDQWDPRPRHPPQSNWREKPYDCPSHNGHLQSRDFLAPLGGHSSFGQPRNNFYPFGGGDTQRQQSSTPRVESTQQYSTYKEWRAARDAQQTSHQRPPLDQRPPDHRPPAGQRPSNHRPPPYQRPSADQRRPSDHRPPPNLQQSASNGPSHGD